MAEPHDPFTFGRLYQALMQTHHYTAEEIGRMTFYQAYLGLGWQPVPRAKLTSEEVQQRILELEWVAQHAVPRG